MIIGLQDPDKFLYHYTKACAAKDHILKNRVLKIGSYTDTNDPKETKRWRFDLWSPSSNGALMDRYRLHHELSDELSDLLKLNTKVLCLSRDSKPLTGDHVADIFNRGFAKPRMWAQYAETHTGVCLVFDRERLGAVIDEACGASCDLFCGNVAYRNREIVPDWSESEYFINLDLLEQVGFKEYVRAHFHAHHKRLFFEKMRDWQDECEFRWIFFSDSQEPLFVDFGRALVGIMFGDGTAEDDIEGMIEMTRGWQLDYMGLRWRNCSRWYDLANPRYVKAPG